MAIRSSRGPVNAMIVPRVAPVRSLCLLRLTLPLPLFQPGLSRACDAQNGERGDWEKHFHFLVPVSTHIATRKGSDFRPICSLLVLIRAPATAGSQVTKV